jgi:hypothetical protein
MVTKTADILRGAFQSYPPVRHEFCPSLPHHEDRGKRKDGQKVITGEEEEEEAAANAEEIRTAM